MIQEERIRFLNDQTVKDGKYVLYWMQCSQRAEFNHALEYSILKANEMNQPTLVYFGINGAYPEANQRHFQFMLEGLKDAQSSLEERGIRMIVLQCSPEIGAVGLSNDASMVVVDRGYLRHLRQWREYAARNMRCPLVQVETDVIIPVEEASLKEEVAAATIRPKIRRKLSKYLLGLEETKPKLQSRYLEVDSLDLANPSRILSILKTDDSVEKATRFHGGTEEAKRHLAEFIRNKLDKFQESRNDPNKDSLSNMSPYLHYGQISPIHIALEVNRTGNQGKEAFLEELVVRRELSINFVYYNKNYDTSDGLPEWAKTTLRKHGKDHRDYLYSMNELENGKTHDEYWNSAQKEMVKTGKMHGYMRMYWGKKIIEWTKTPDDAFRIALYLNNKYELDGRDPNGFTGVAWCFGKHDRPWKERPIFGKVRYMSAKGLERKFDMRAYLARVGANADHAYSV